MPETKAGATKRARRVGIPTSHVVKGKAGYFIAPHGVTKAKAKRAYAGCRSGGGSKAMCAGVAHKVQRRK